jgi:hypothetical protein
VECSRRVLQSHKRSIQPVILALSVPSLSAQQHQICKSQVSNPQQKRSQLRNCRKRITYHGLCLRDQIIFVGPRARTQWSLMIVGIKISLLPVSFPSSGIKGPILWWIK